MCLYLRSILSGVVFVTLIFLISCSSENSRNNSEEEIFNDNDVSFPENGNDTNRSETETDGNVDEDVSYYDYDEIFFDEDSKTDDEGSKYDSDANVFYDEDFLPSCVDLCAVGEISELGRCTLWDDKNSTWIEEIDDGEGNMHNRARTYTALMREKTMHLQGVFRTYYTDETFETVIQPGGVRDAPIWVGTYIAAEAFRYKTTKAPDALEQIEKSIRTLDFWWRISGNKGYLARFAAPHDSPSHIQKVFEFPKDDPENQFNFEFEGELWNWKGDISRDQYQGVMFGLSIAYDILKNEEIKEIIRRNIVDFAEQLMEKKTRTIMFSINGNVPVPTQVEVQYAVYNKHETPTGNPTVTIQTDPFEQQDDGMLTFWPNPSIYIRKVPGFGWIPDIYLRSQAIQLASIFKIALQVTEDVPGYEGRRQALLEHYNEMYFEWSGMAEGWENSNKCGDSYHGLNIAFLPAFNWVRLEDEPIKKAFLRDNVFRDRMWSAVHDHKNVFFAYLYSVLANPADNTDPIIAAHTDQLKQFPPPPYIAVSIDNTGKYEENPNCKGLSKTAIDVQDRIPAGFIWERNPWKLKEEAPEGLTLLYPGLDYIVTYWMARHYGYLENDAPDTCLRWKK